MLVQETIAGFRSPQKRTLDPTLSLCFLSRLLRLLGVGRVRKDKMNCIARRQVCGKCNEICLSLVASTAHSLLVLVQHRHNFAYLLLACTLR